MAQFVWAISGVQVSDFLLPNRGAFGQRIVENNRQTETRVNVLFSVTSQWHPIC